MRTVGPGHSEVFSPGAQSTTASTPPIGLRVRTRKAKKQLAPSVLGHQNYILMKAPDGLPLGKWYVLRKYITPHLSPIVTFTPGPLQLTQVSEIESRWSRTITISSSYSAYRWPEYVSLPPSPPTTIKKVKGCCQPFVGVKLPWDSLKRWVHLERCLRKRREATPPTHLPFSLENGIGLPREP